MKKNKKARKNGKAFSVKEVSIIMVITILIGVVIGAFISYTMKDKIFYNKYSSNYEEIIDTYQNIKSNYYKDIESKELLDAAINGMIEHLDDEYSNFLTQEESQKENKDLDKDYIGIGCSIKEENKKILIEEVYENTPAYNKLKKKDQIIKIDNTVIKDLGLNQVSLLISGKENTTIKITVKRDNKEKTYTLKRKKIENPTVYSKIEKNIGYIQITSFSENTSKQFKKELEKLEKQKIKGLIIDLRDNIGGYISSAEEIASIFLKKDQVIYQLEKKGIISKVKDQTKENKNTKVIVLVNKNTASSAEVLASALKEQYNAKLVGEKTYGKASIQKVYNLSSGASYKYTIEKWRTAKGNVVDKKGITPDILVQMEKNTKEDIQFEKAMEQFN